MFVFLFPGLNETSGSNQRNLGMLMFVLLTDSVYCYFLGVQINFFSPFPFFLKVLRISVMVASVLSVACGFLAPLIFLQLRKKTQSRYSS